jgi:hypothetical protein
VIKITTRKRRVKKSRDIGTLAAFGLGVASSVAADALYDRYKKKQRPMSPLVREWLALLETMHASRKGSKAYEEADRDAEALWKVMTPRERRDAVEWSYALMGEP